MIVACLDQKIQWLILWTPTPLTQWQAINQDSEADHRIHQVASYDPGCWGPILTRDSHGVYIFVVVNQAMALSPKPNSSRQPAWTRRWPAMNSIILTKIRMVSSLGQTSQTSTKHSTSTVSTCIIVSAFYIAKMYMELRTTKAEIKNRYQVILP